MSSSVSNAKNPSNLSQVKPAAGNNRQNNGDANNDMSIGEPKFNTGVVVSLATRGEGQDKNSKQTNIMGKLNTCPEKSKEIQNSWGEYVHKPISGHLIEKLTSNGIDYYCKGNSGYTKEGSGQGNSGMSSPVASEDRGLKKLKMSEGSIEVEV